MHNNKASPIKNKLYTLLDGTADMLLRAAAVLMLLIAGYCAYDALAVTQAASAARFTVYKPGACASSPSYAELQALNPEVVGWLTVNGTGIDYPLVQSGDNLKYLTHNAKGEEAGSGSLFLDYRSSPAFDQPATLIYGHHMENGVMFGDITKFADAAYFKAHQTGSVFYNGELKRIEIIAYLNTNAWDPVLYGLPYSDTGSVMAQIRACAVNMSDTQVYPQDHLILMSTCEEAGGDERQLLAAKITGSAVTTPEQNGPNTAAPDFWEIFMDFFETLPWNIWLIVGLSAAILTLSVIERRRRRQ